MQKRLSFSVPLFYGRGIFNYEFGLLPRRRYGRRPPPPGALPKPSRCPPRTSRTRRARL